MISFCIAANKQHTEESTPDNEIRQWETDYQLHAVDAIDALEKDGGGQDDVTTENAS